MDTNEPTLMCERCREPMSSADHFQVLTGGTRRTGEPASISGKVVHEKCWAAWAEANEIE